MIKPAITTNSFIDISQWRSQFSVPAEPVGELHLAGSTTLGLEQPRRCNDDANAHCSRNRDIQPVCAVKELHSPRSVSVTGGRHGINDDRGFLTLEFVDGADAGAGNAFLQLEDLRVVRRDDQDIVERNRRFFPAPINPGRAGFQYVRNEVADRVGLLGRRALIAVVLNGKVPKSRTLQSRVGFDLLPLESRPGFQAAFVKQLRIECADERMSFGLQY
jgi:hypothetical protein